MSQRPARLSIRSRPGRGQQVYSDQIDLRLGPALDTLRAMPAEPAYDLAFIDADYLNYSAYWEEVVPRVKPGGAITGRPPSLVG